MIVLIKTEWAKYETMRLVDLNINQVIQDVNHFMFGFGKVKIRVINGMSLN